MSLQLERLASKPQAIQTFTIAPIPRAPEWFVRQFKLEEWQADWERWRINTQNNIREALQAVQSQNE